MGKLGKSKKSIVPANKTFRANNAGIMATDTSAPPAGNLEGVLVSLPNDITMDNLPDVKLYGMYISPPCVKVRVILDHYKVLVYVKSPTLTGFQQVKYTRVDGKKPGSEYKKIPVLDVGDQQINDS